MTDTLDLSLGIERPANHEAHDVWVVAGHLLGTQWKYAGVEMRIVDATVKVQPGDDGREYIPVVELGDKSETDSGYRFTLTEFRTAVVEDDVTPVGDTADQIIETLM